jgi:hypothetical protein
LPWRNRRRTGRFSQQAAFVNPLIEVGQSMAGKPELIRSFSQKLVVDGFCNQAITLKPPTAKRHRSPEIAG